MNGICSLDRKGDMPPVNSTQAEVVFTFSDVEHGGNQTRKQCTSKLSFFIITSEAQEHVVNGEMMSARYFIAIYERFVGFSSDKVVPKNLDASQRQSITFFNGVKLIPYDQLKDNHIID